MIFDLVDPNPPVKVVIGKDDKDDAFLMLRPASAEALENIRKKTHTKKLKNIRGVIHESIKIDEDAYDLAFWGYSLPEWGGIRDAKGKEIPCTPKNVVALIKKSPHFSGIVSEALDEVQGLIAKRTEDLAKNL